MQVTLKRIKDFITKDIWNRPIRSYSPREMFLVKQLRIFTLAFKGFAEDRVQIRASALTYYTILSIVPIIAMVFGVAKGFGFDAWLQEKILSSLSGQEKVMQWILTFVERYLTNIKGGVIAGVGVVLLLWSVMKLLGNIEDSFNDIWQIKKARGMSRKMSDYISLVVIAPILIFVSSSVTVFLSEQIESSSEVFPLLGYIGPLLSFLVALIPYVLIWLVFTLLYIIMPNTKVNLKSAIIAGIIAGTIFQLLQWAYIQFQSMLTSYGAVYGSFAAFPLFLMWLQLSWLIVFLGAEIAFANQNVEHYEAESESTSISYHLKRIITLIVVKEIVLNFKNGMPPATAAELANKLDLSVRLIRDIIYELIETNIVSETVTKNVKENAYQPAQDIQRLTVSYILDILDRRGNNTMNTNNNIELEKFQKIMDGFSEEIKKSKNNKLVCDLGEQG